MVSKATKSACLMYFAAYVMYFKILTTVKNQSFKLLMESFDYFLLRPPITTLKITAFSPIDTKKTNLLTAQTPPDPYQMCVKQVIVSVIAKLNNTVCLNMAGRL